VKKTAAAIGNDKNKKIGYIKIARKLVNALSFLYYNNIPYKRVLDNPGLFKKNSFSMEGIVIITQAHSSSSKLLSSMFMIR
jgi:hypothetical protein